MADVNIPFISNNVGNIGVGTDNPMELFHVAGVITASRVSASLFKGDLDGTAYLSVSSSWSSGSISSSYSSIATNSIFASQSRWAISSSWTSASLTTVTASYSHKAENATFASQSKWAVSASWSSSSFSSTTSSYALSSSYAEVVSSFQINTISASYASSSTSASVVLTLEPNITDNVDNRLLTATGGGTINAEANLLYNNSSFTILNSNIDLRSVDSGSTTTGFRMNAGEGFAIYGNNSFFGTAEDAIIFQMEDVNSWGGATDGGFVFRGWSPSSSGSNATASNWLAIKSGPNVGIGTMYPVSSLQVIGHVSASSFGSGSFHGTASYANTSNVSTTTLFASQSRWAISASFASSSVTSSYTHKSENAMFASQSLWAISASLTSRSLSSVTSSYTHKAQNSFFASQSLWSVSASLSSASLTSITSSYSHKAGNAIFASQSRWAISSSFASASVSLLGTNYNISVIFASQSRWATSASYASRSLTASYVENATPVFAGKTDNYLPKWSSNTLTGTSNIYDDGTNVGIGTDNPLYSLTIKETANSAILGLIVDDALARIPGVYLINNTSVEGTFRLEQSSNLPHSVIIEAGSGGSTYTAIKASGSSVLQLMPNGGVVGIGTTLPTSTAILTVASSSRITEGASSTGELQFGLSDTIVGYSESLFRIRTWAGNNEYYESLRSVGLSRYTILAPTTGSVGVGTSSPQSLLHVFGHISASGFGSGTFHGTSSYANKSNISENALFASQSRWAVSSSWASSSVSASYTRARTNVFDNIRTLATTHFTIENNEPVIVRGYYNVGDWGGVRIAKYTSSTAETANIGNVFTASMGGRFIFDDRNEPVQNLKWWGAKGDGVTDDYTAISTSLAYSNHIEIPPGRYNHSQPIVVNTNEPISIKSKIGSYQGGWIPFNDVKEAEFVYKGSLTTTAFDLTSTNIRYGCDLENVSFDASGSAGYALRIGNLGRGSFKSVRANGAITASFHLTASQFGLFERCSTSTNDDDPGYTPTQYGILLGGTNTCHTFVDCIVENSSVYGVYLGFQSINNTFINGTIESNTGGGLFISQSSVQNTFDNIWFENNGTGADDIHISNQVYWNVFRNIYFNDSDDICRVSGSYNTFESCRFGYLYINSDSSRNRFNNCVYITGYNDLSDNLNTFSNFINAVASTRRDEIPGYLTHTLKVIDDGVLFRGDRLTDNTQYLEIGEDATGHWILGTSRNTNKKIMTIGTSCSYDTMDSGFAYLYFNTSGSTKVWIDETGNLLPYVTSVYDLGSPTKRWNNVYANNLVGTSSLTNTSSYSLTSSYIGNGTTNYLPKWVNNALTSTSSIYDNNTNVGIGTGAPSAKLHVMSNNSLLKLTRSDITTQYLEFTEDALGHSIFAFSPNSNKKILTIGTSHSFDTTSGTAGYLYFNTSGSTKVWIDETGNLLPYVTNTYDLGSPTRKWNNVYANNLVGTASLATTTSYAVSSLVAVSSSYAEVATTARGVYNSGDVQIYAGTEMTIVSNGGNMNITSPTDIVMEAGNVVDINHLVSGDADLIGNITNANKAISASYASSSFYSLQSISSSFASSSITSSYSHKAQSAIFASQSFWTVSASYASKSFWSDTLQGSSSVYFTLRPVNTQISGNAVHSADTRGDDYSPFSRSAGIYFDLKSNTTDGLSDGGTLHGNITFRPYGSNVDMTGGPPHQLGFTQNGNLWIRTGELVNSGSWGSWSKFLREGTGSVYNVTTSIARTASWTWTSSWAWTSSYTHIAQNTYFSSQSRWSISASFSSRSVSSSWSDLANPYFTGKTNGYYPKWSSNTLTGTSLISDDSNELTIRGPWRITSGSTSLTTHGELFGSWEPQFGGGWARGIGWVSGSNVQAMMGGYGNASDGTFNYLYFGSGSNVYARPWMVITNDGAIGIGTTSPICELDIGGTLNADRAVRISAGNSGTNSASLFMGTATREWRMVVNNSVGEYRFHFDYLGSSPYNNVFVMSSNSNVGIRTNPLSTDGVAISGSIKLYGPHATQGGNLISGIYASWGETYSGFSTILGNNLIPHKTVANTVYKHASSIESGSYIQIHYQRGIGFYAGITGSINTEINSLNNTFHSMTIHHNRNVGIGTTEPVAILNTLSQNGNGPYFDCGSSGGSGTTAININKSGTTYLNIRGDGYVGINASPSTTGQVYINSINSSTAHLSLASGITNSNASSTYTFRGWWGIYFNTPSFGGTALYYIQIYN